MLSLFDPQRPLPRWHETQGSTLARTQCGRPRWTTVPRNPHHHIVRRWRDILDQWRWRSVHSKFWRHVRNCCRWRELLDHWCWCRDHLLFVNKLMSQHLRLIFGLVEALNAMGFVVVVINLLSLERAPNLFDL